LMPLAFLFLLLQTVREIMLSYSKYKDAA